MSLPSAHAALFSLYSSGERAQGSHQEQNQGDREDGASVLRIEVSRSKEVFGPSIFLTLYQLLEANSFMENYCLKKSLNLKSEINGLFVILRMYYLISPPSGFFQGRVRIGPAVEGPDPDGRAAAGGPLRRKELAEQRPAGILAKPQNNIVRRGQGECELPDLPTSPGSLISNLRSNLFDLWVTSEVIWRPQFLLAICNKIQGNLDRGARF